VIDHGLALPGTPDKESRADVVTVIDQAGIVRQAIISEPQSTRPTLRKWFSWVIYVGVAGYKFRCQATLLVLPLNDETARACRAGFTAGPNIRVNLVVVDRQSTPHPDAEGGEDCVVQITMLNFLNGKFDLSDPDTRRYVLDQLAKADIRLRGPYTHAVWYLSEPDVRKDLEADMTLTDLYVPFLDDPIITTAAEMLLDVIEARRLAITPEYQALLEECRDPKQIKTWAKRATTAKTIDEIFTPEP
jgi:hypothetical protein